MARGTVRPHVSGVESTSAQPTSTTNTASIRTTGLHSPCHCALTDSLILVQTIHSQLSHTPLLQYNLQHFHIYCILMDNVL